ncbi:Hypothetical protein R9X50_00066800 [Acrodontium crateriforme]|uniref:Uncharacterized protein n=1 Tax=Acrodontium crateriforme TaxID=150365 RepID=A0AAQ3M3M6_9PEZI|nr:Hypothetical protein R9X50_00066800 [Acrodontium crateriforme]
MLELGGEDDGEAAQSSGTFSESDDILLELHSHKRREKQQPTPAYEGGSPEPGTALTSGKGFRQIVDMGHCVDSAGIVDECDLSISASPDSDSVSHVPSREASVTTLANDEAPYTNTTKRKTGLAASDPLANKQRKTADDKWDHLQAFRGEIPAHVVKPHVVAKRLDEILLATFEGDAREIIISTLVLLSQVGMTDIVDFSLLGNHLHRLL